MSYEGINQYLCANGHHWNIDCYHEDSTVCPVCGAAVTTRHSVDETNGSEESDYLQLEMIEVPKCLDCGSHSGLSAPRFRIKENLASDPASQLPTNQKDNLSIPTIEVTEK